MSRKTIFSLFLVILGGFTLLLLLTKVQNLNLLNLYNCCRSVAREPSMTLSLTRWTIQIFIMLILQSRRPITKVRLKLSSFCTLLPCSIIWLIKGFTHATTKLSIYLSNITSVRCINTKWWSLGLPSWCHFKCNKSIWAYQNLVILSRKYTMSISWALNFSSLKSEVESRYYFAFFWS